MDRAPSFQLILETSWRLLLERGWLIFWIMLAAALPLTAYSVSLRLDLIPNLFSSAISLAGDRPRLSEDGWLSVVWYTQKISIIKTSISVVVFGWINAIAITLCAFIATDWQSGQTTAKEHLVRRLFPAVLIVWLALIITRICGQVLSSAFVLPALVLSALWYVATFVAADEKVGVIQSLKKSYTLTRHFRWGVFALVCFFWIVGFGSGVFRSRVLLLHFLDSGYDIQHWVLLDLALREIVGFAQGFANMIVVSATYLVLKRVHVGPSSRELDFVFD